MKLLGPEWQHTHLEGLNGALERQAATALMESLGGLSLAIVQAAILIKDERVGGSTVQGFLELYEARRRTLPVRQVASRDRLIHSLDTVWALALDILSLNARSLLSVLSLLAPDYIRLELFLPSNQSRLEGRLSFCKRAVSTGSDLRLASTLDTTPAMEAALEELRNAKLIHQHGRVLRIHRVIQEAMNFNDIHQLQDSFDAATQLLYDAFPKQDEGRPMNENWVLCQTYIQHAISLANGYVKIRAGPESPFRSSKEFVRLLANCGW